ncbi:MAG: restriction endonuclease subunit S [Pseudomonadales bacterium]
MNPETFFEKFDRFAGAPDAVVKMREMVLGLAITGNLVDQEPHEGLASDLVSKATAARARLIAEKKLKKAREIRPVAEFERPTIPNSWTWTSLGEIAEIAPRNAVEDSTLATFLPMPAIPQQYGGKLNGELRRWSELKKGFTHLANGDIALAKITPCFQNGKSAVIEGLENGIGAGTTELHVARPFVPVVEPYYVWIFLRSPQFLLEGIRHMTGSAGQKRVPAGYFACKPFPLPPLAEQKRIVAKVDELMALCDRLEAQQQERDTRHAVLARASLSRFADAPTPANLQFLFHKSYDIDPADLRKSILTLAVQGKLVPQSRNDDPASLNDRDTDSKGNPPPFALPENWLWTSLVEVSSEIVDCPHSTPKWTDSGKYCVRTSQLNPGFLDLASAKFVSEKTFEERIKRLKPTENDILYCREGQVGNACRIPPGIELCLGQRMMLIRSSSQMDPRMLELILNSPFIAARVGTLITGMTAPRVNVKMVKDYWIPVPPLKEQGRIVAKVERLMALVDELETQIAESRTTAKNLLEALVADLTAAGAPSPTVAANL